LLINRGDCAGASMCSRCARRGKPPCGAIAPLVMHSQGVLHRRMDTGTSIELGRSAEKLRIVVVWSGLIKRYQITDDGNQLIFGFDLPSAVILTQEGARPQLLEAIEETTICVLDQASILQSLRESVSAFEWFSAVMASNVQSLETKVELLNERTSNLRLLRFLFAYAAQRGLSPPVRSLQLPIKRDDIGRYLNMSPETVSRAFSALHDMAFIRMRGPRCIDLLSGLDVIARAGK
jgi:CRP-like cAMP-binding protein